MIVAADAPASTDVGEKKRSSGQTIESFGVAISHCAFVVVGKPLIMLELAQFIFASVVVHLVGKIGRENEGLVADHTDCERQRELIALDADIDAPFIDMPLDLVGDRFIGSELQKTSARIVLHMSVPGALQSLDAVHEPA